MPSPSNEQRELDAEWERWLACHICGKPVDETAVEIVRPKPTEADPFPPYFAPCCAECKPAKTNQFCTECNGAGYVKRQVCMGPPFTRPCPRGCKEPAR